MVITLVFQTGDLSSILSTRSNGYMVKWYHRALIRLYLEFDSRCSYKNGRYDSGLSLRLESGHAWGNSRGIDTSTFLLYILFV